jgi:hypothetical protein
MTPPQAAKAKLATSNVIQQCDRKYLTVYAFAKGVALPSNLSIWLARAWA